MMNQLAYPRRVTVTWIIWFCMDHGILKGFIGREQTKPTKSTSFLSLKLSFPLVMSNKSMIQTGSLIRSICKSFKSCTNYGIIVFVQGSFMCRRRHPKCISLSFHHQHKLHSRNNSNSKRGPWAALGARAGAWMHDDSWNPKRHLRLLDYHYSHRRLGVCPD